MDTYANPYNTTDGMMGDEDLQRTAYIYSHRWRNHLDI